jgi:predicted  nucleic acid-binding Zn-ribbon protein
MPVKETLRRLVELARLDDQLAALEREQGVLPARRAQLEEEQADLRRRLEAARSEMASGESRQRQLERELADAEALRNRLEQQQYEITSRDAYQALLHEMTAARESISCHESEILELMDRLDEQRSALAALEREAQELEARGEERLRELEERSEQLAKQVGRVQQARSELVSQLGSEALERYQRIAGRRRPAVVVVSSELCTECRVGIPPQLFLQILAGESLAACGSCHRILIHERIVEG